MADSLKPQHGKLTRRAMLAGLVVTSAAGCDGLSTEPESAGQAEDAAGEGTEAPMLAKRVEAGELPPLSERLPKNPLVVEPVERPGVYGGTWNTALLGTADTAWLTRTIGYDSVLAWTPDWSGIVPNVAESVEMSDDGREFTISLREGTKWSDGEPFTADDLIFAWDEVLLNQQLAPVTPTYMVVGGDPGGIEKIDDYRVLVTFPRPSGLFEMHLAFMTRALIQHPAHYLRNFHVDHNPEVRAEATDEGYAGWPEYFLAKAALWENPDLPRLHPWVITVELGSGDRVVAERNPYYFKTDPDGRQLPYIDEVAFEVVSDEQVMLLQAANGEIAFHTRHFNTLPNKPVLAESRETGGYRFNSLLPAFEGEMIIGLNQSHDDPELREVFQNKDFRIGLSHAINREELVDVVFQRQGRPWQAAPREESEFYDEAFATQYLDYDVDLANEHLDRAGYTERDNEGYRLRPDGERISFTVEVAQPALVPFWADGMELVQTYWKDVGVHSRVKPLDRSLFWEHLEANAYDGTVWTGYGGLSYGVLLEPGYYFPFSYAHAKYASAWGTWFSSRGESGAEPPDPTRRQMELYWQLMETPDEDDRKDLMREILAIAKEQFYVIGTAIATEGYGVVRNDFHNVPDSMPESHIYATPAGSHPEQYFMD